MNDEAVRQDLMYRTFRFFFPQTGITPELNAGEITDFWLAPAYPNPFNPATTIRYGLPEPAEVEIEVFNIQGQKVRQLVRGRRAAGWHTVQWNGQNDRGIPLSSGVYLIRLNARTSDNRLIVRNQKVMLIK